MYFDYPGAPIGPQAQFSYTTYPDSNTVDCLDESTCGECSIIFWYWTFGDGTTSNQQHPSHIYAEESTYTVSLTVTSDTELSNTVSYDIIVPQPLEYCASQAQNTGTNISEVVLGDFCHPSGATVYSDFTGEIIDVDAGESYPLTLSLGTGKWYSNWFCVWIDLNRDGDFFDDGEKVYQSSTAHTGDETGTISIPDFGSVTTRMRVTVKRKVLANPEAPEPCEEFYRGEVEDYAVRIHASAPVTCDSDFDFDFDVDGIDLANYGDKGTSRPLAAFAHEFGSPDCR